MMGDYLVKEKINLRDGLLIFLKIIKYSKLFSFIKT